MKEIVLVAGGGAIGAALRYAVGGVIAGRVGNAFPWHTFAINVVGAFLLGLLMALSAERAVIGTEWRVFLGIGLLGGFTTFSTLTYESVRLLEQGFAVAASLNLLGSGLAGLVAAVLGLVVGRAI